jgi:hypothetical protein
VTAIEGRAIGMAVVYPPPSSQVVKLTMPCCHNRLRMRVDSEADGLVAFLHLDGKDLLAETSSLDRGRRALLALERKGVLLVARDLSLLRHVLCKDAQ